MAQPLTHTPEPRSFPETPARPAHGARGICRADRAVTYSRPDIPGHPGTWHHNDDRTPCHHHETR